MNKKQLTLQNSSLFAELERKTKEIEILSIRLEESEKKALSLQSECQQLKGGVSAANEEIINLKNQIDTAANEYNMQIEALKSELEEAKAECDTAKNLLAAATESLTYNIDNIGSNCESAPLTEADEEIIPEIKNEESPVFEQTTEVYETVAPAPEPEIEIESDYIAEPIRENVKQNTNVPHSPAEEINIKAPLTDSAPMNDMLRDYGAKIIGKVTRVTAEVIAKISSVDDDVASSLKTLALGKNESFKFRIMELAREKSDYEKIIEEMDFLAEETIVYLRSI